MLEQDDRGGLEGGDSALHGGGAPTGPANGWNPPYFDPAIPFGSEGGRPTYPPSGGSGLPEDPYDIGYKIGVTVGWGGGGEPPNPIRIGWKPSGGSPAIETGGNPWDALGGGGGGSETSRGGGGSGSLSASSEAPGGVAGIGKNAPPAGLESTPSWKPISTRRNDWTRRRSV